MSFELPVVKIGTRQAGRMRAKNTTDVDYNCEEVTNGIREALAPETRLELRGQKNPYGDGYAASRILKRLKEVPLDARLHRKPFSNPAQDSGRLEWSASGS